MCRVLSSLSTEQVFPSLPALPCAFHETLPYHCLFSPESAIACMGELANPTQSAVSNLQLLITYSSLVNFVKFDCFPPLLDSTFLCACACLGGVKRNHHCCFKIQQGCKTPAANLTAQGRASCFYSGACPGQRRKLGIHSPVEPSPGPAQGVVSEEADAFRGGSISPQPLGLGICQLLVEVQPWCRWT